MGFNIPLFKTMGRGWGRGSPPPRGSIEWAGVADMWEPDPPRSSSGFQVFEIGFTELDAADRWMKRMEDNINYAIRLHGNKILNDADLGEWDALMLRWVPFRLKLTSPLRSPLNLQMWLKDNKITLDKLLNESKAMHDRFAKKGMSMVPMPYMGELVLLLRQMPKKLTAAQMQTKLEAGIECGEKLLDEDTAWWQWRKRDDTKGLVAAIANAKAASGIFAKSKRTSENYHPGDPAYDEFIRRLTKIWIEAAGLYGIIETEKTAAAEGLDAGRKAAQKEESGLWKLLLLAGAGYLGIRWLTRDKTTVVVGVPDAHPAEPEIYY